MIQQFQGQPCSICRKVAPSLQGAEPHLNAENQIDGYICASCVNYILRKNPHLTRSFNLQDHKEAQKTMKITIHPSELTPEFLQEFEDEDSFFDFIDSLSEHECSIMKQHGGNPDILRQIRELVVSDLDETSKDLAME